MTTSECLAEGYFPTDAVPFSLNLICVRLPIAELKDAAHQQIHAPTTKKFFNSGMLREKSQFSFEEVLV